MGPPVGGPAESGERVLQDALADAKATYGERLVSAYRLGSLAVDVVDGIATVAGTDTIAGSTATMARLFRNAVVNSGLPRDEALALAVRQTSINPARAVGLPEAGLVVGRPADLVVLDADLRVQRVLHRGSWVDGVMKD